MTESWKIFIVAAILSYTGSTLMRPVTEPTTEEIIGFLLLISGLISCGIFVKTTQIEEQEKVN